jgi:hypothetical protein
MKNSKVKELIVPKLMEEFKTTDDFRIELEGNEKNWIYSDEHYEHLIDLIADELSNGKMKDIRRDGCFRLLGKEYIFLTIRSEAIQEYKIGINLPY